MGRPSNTAQGSGLLGQVKWGPHLSVGGKTSYISGCDGGCRMGDRRSTFVAFVDEQVRLAGTLAGQRGSTGGVPVAPGTRGWGQTALSTTGKQGVVAAAPEVDHSSTSTFLVSGGYRASNSGGASFNWLQGWGEQLHGGEGRRFDVGFGGGGVLLL